MCPHGGGSVGNNHCVRFSSNVPLSTKHWYIRTLEEPFLSEMLKHILIYRFNVTQALAVFGRLSRGRCFGVLWGCRYRIEPRCCERFPNALQRRKGLQRTPHITQKRMTKSRRVGPQPPTVLQRKGHPLGNLAKADDTPASTRYDAVAHSAGPARRRLLAKRSVLAGSR